MDIKNLFITTDAFKSLAGCVIVAEACTETTKMLLGVTNALWISFGFSVMVAVIRILLSRDYSKENILLGLINILPIFLAGVGIYQVGIKKIPDDFFTTMFSTISA